MSLDTLADIPPGLRIGYAVGGPSLYYQCNLRQGHTQTTGWIEARGARVGAHVEIKDEPGHWVVMAVFQPGRDMSWLREKQRMDRASLGSIKGD